MSIEAFFQIKVHPLLDSNNGNYGQGKLFTKSNSNVFLSCLDTFDSVGLVVAGFAILLMGRGAGGLAEPLLRFDAHVQVLLLRSTLTLGHPARVLNCQGGFLFCWCRLSVMRMKVPKLKVDVNL